MAKSRFEIQDGISFYNNWLEVVEPRIYEVKFNKIIFPDIIPVSTGLPPGVESWSYLMSEHIGRGAWISDWSSELPRADIDMEKFTQPIHYAGISYGYSLRELQAAALSGGRVDLELGRITACRYGAESQMQEVAFEGDSEKDIKGFFNFPLVPTLTPGMDWTVKGITGNAIVEDCNALLRHVMTTTKGAHIPDTLLVPLSQWNRMWSAKMDGPTILTAMEFLRQNNPFTAFTGKPLTVKAVVHLEEAGAGLKPRMVAYEKKRENVTMQIVEPFTPHNPIPKNLHFTVSASYAYGGVIFRYPLSACYRDFVNA